MYVVMAVQDFEFEPANFPLEVKVETGKMIGYLPVYQTKDDALTAFPEGNILEAREVPKKLDNLND